MTEYTLTAAGVLAIGAVLAVAIGLHRDPRAWIGLAVFGSLTIVVDILLRRFGVYGHGSHFQASVLIDRMPIEDLLYGLALYLVAVVSWAWTPHRTPAPTGTVMRPDHAH